MFSKHSKLRKKNQLGFSLIEVLITSVIIGVVSAIVVVRYGAFNSSVLLKNQAYEIALAVRQAQVFTVSSRGQGNDFRDEYGVYIDLNTGTTQQMILFIDTIDDGAYSNDTEVVDSITIDSRFEITDICLADANDVINGTPDCSADGLKDLSVMFARPDFDAEFAATGDPSPTAARMQTTIVLSPVDGSPVSRSIIVNSAGQISVE